MTDSRPAVTIGLPVYNGGTFLAEGLESLLGQTFGDFELIVSDNASTDETEAVCRAYAAKDERLRYERQPVNRGGAWNFNHVLDLARGRYFKWVAHDDVHAPEFLRRCVETLEREPDVALSMATTVDIDGRGQVLRVHEWNKDTDSVDPVRRFREMLYDRHFFPIFGLAPTDLVRLTGGHGAFIGSDRTLLAELALHGRIKILPDRLFLHREHDLRSVRVLPSRAARIAWYDPAKAGTVPFLFWRLAGEYLRVIRRSPLGPVARIRCRAAVGAWMLRRSKNLIADVVFAALQISGKVLRLDRRSHADPTQGKAAT
jgi:glycosyltransferase involved in cell wall biosynthesis